VAVFFPPLNVRAGASPLFRARWQALRSQELFTNKRETLIPDVASRHFFPSLIVSLRSCTPGLEYLEAAFAQQPGLHLARIPDTFSSSMKSTLKFRRLLKIQLSGTHPLPPCQHDLVSQALLPNATPHFLFRLSFPSSTYSSFPIPLLASTVSCYAFQTAPCLKTNFFFHDRWTFSPQRGRRAPLPSPPRQDAVSLSLEKKSQSLHFFHIFLIISCCFLLPLKRWRFFF